MLTAAMHEPPALESAFLADEIVAHVLRIKADKNITEIQRLYILGGNEVEQAAAKFEQQIKKLTNSLVLSNNTIEAAHAHREICSLSECCAIIGIVADKAL